MKKYIEIGLVFFWLLSGSLIVFEYLSHTNFVLNTFQVSYPDLFLISSLTLAGWFVITRKTALLKDYKLFIFVLPIFLILASLLLFMRRFDLFLFFEAEDSVVETSQVILIFSSSILSFVASRLYASKKILSMLLLVAAIGFFFIFGEEISWGQRIFNIETPAEYAELNTQGEITLHNYGPLFGLVYWGYAGIGLIGATAWTIKKYLRKHRNTIIKQLGVLIPEWQYFFYFLTAFLYSLEVHILNPRAGRATGNALWEEPMELLLFIGITLFLIELVIRKKYNVKT